MVSFQVASSFLGRGPSAASHPRIRWNLQARSECRSRTGVLLAACRTSSRCPGRGVVGDGGGGFPGTVHRSLTGSALWWRTTLPEGTPRAGAVDLPTGHTRVLVGEEVGNSGAHRTASGCVGGFSGPCTCSRRLDTVVGGHYRGSPASSAASSPRGSRRPTRNCATCAPAST